MATVIRVPVYCLLVAVTWINSMNAENLRPIIGVVAQENRDWPGRGDSFIRDTYFHFVEQAGARAVPIKIDQSESYYKDMFSSINGLLLPGGGADPVKSGYARAARAMFQMAIKANDAGDVFPIWGTCLGFEQLSVLVGGNVLTAVDGWNLSLPLNFTKDYKETRMYGELSSAVSDYIRKHGAAQNMHHYGLLTKTFRANSNLSSFFNVLTTNTDRTGKEYVSSMEGKKYPFYGVQFHPEKNIYDWDGPLNVDHSRLAVTFAQTLADFFVQQARQSNHAFSSVKAESAALIQNYPGVYLGEPTFYRIYFFNVTPGAETPSNQSDAVPPFTLGDPVRVVIQCYHDNVTLLLTTVVMTCLLILLLHVVRQAALRRRLSIYRLLPASPAPDQQPDALIKS